MKPVIVPAMFKSFVIIGIFVLGVAAQETKVPILVDEFEELANCCDFRGRVDNFLEDIANHATDVGLVVTVGSRENLVNKVFREEMIRSHVLFRKFDPARLRFVRAEGDTVKTMLWRLPDGSKMPELVGTDNTYVMNVDKPTLLLADYPNGDGGLCPETEPREIFAFFLAASPTARAKVVIRGHSRRESTRVERELSRFFVNENELDRGRLQFVHTKTVDESGFGRSIEYWYLP